MLSLKVYDMQETLPADDRMQAITRVMVTATAQVQCSPPPCDVPSYLGMPATLPPLGRFAGACCRFYSPLHSNAGSLPKIDSL